MFGRGPKRKRTSDIDIWLVLWGGTKARPLSAICGVYLSMDDAIERAEALSESGASNLRLGRLIEGPGIGGSNLTVYTVTNMAPGRIVLEDPKTHFRHE